MSDGADEIRLTLRLPAGLRDLLLDRGKENGRSLNAEIVSRLERSARETDEGSTVSVLTDRIEKLERLVQDHSRILSGRAD